MFATTSTLVLSRVSLKTLTLNNVHMINSALLPCWSMLPVLVGGTFVGVLPGTTFGTAPFSTSSLLLSLGAHVPELSAAIPET